MKRSEKFSDIKAIADDVCANLATEEQLAELEEKLRGNPEAIDFYFDYLSVHNQLKSAAERNSEIVYRRMTEEVVVRPQGTSQPYSDIAKAQFTSSLNKVKFFNFVVLIALLAVLLVWLFLDRDEPRFTAKIVQGKINILGEGNIDGQHIFNGEYDVIKSTLLELNNGDTMELSAGSQIKLFTDTEVKLKAGKLKVTSASGSNIFVHGDSFRLATHGGTLSLDLTNKQAIVTSGANTILNAERWRPKHYWSFDDSSDRAINSASAAHGVVLAGANRVKGHIGLGAFDFDNSANARIDLGTGGGTAPATGTFSATDGLTIETLIAPRYSGKLGEIDEIFRKGHLDGKLRVSLGLHYSQTQDSLQPKMVPSPSISFGLYIVGQGYQKLQLPLDGKAGRPTLAQLTNGQVYHIVASYNVSTGIKAIYIDGQVLASYQYPPGSKLLSGGPGKASIGNNPTKKYWKKFAFSGVIDELAFYDFALPTFMIEHHIMQVEQGLNYFGLQPSAKLLPEQVKITLPANTTIALEPLTSLPAKLITH